MPPDRLKVAHVSVFPREGKTHSEAGDLSALAGYLYSLLTHLPRTGFRHVVLTNIKSGRARCYRREGWVVIESWRKGSPLFAWDIAKALTRLRDVKIVHLQHEFNQFGMANLPLVLAVLFFIKYGLRKTLVATVHEVLDPRTLSEEFLSKSSIRAPAFVVRPLLRAYYWMLGACCDGLFAQDAHFAEILSSACRTPCPVRILPIGTESLDPPARPLARRALALPEDGRVVAFFGTLDWRKGLDVLLGALELLPDGYCTLLVGGGQPVRTRDGGIYQEWHGRFLERAARMPGVRLLGFVEDVRIPLLFGAADLVVLPYLVPQRVSAVFNQTCSYGRPLLASSVFSGQADPVMLFEPETRPLAGKIRWAFEEGGLDTLGAASRRFARANSWTSSASILLQTYRDLRRGGGKK